MNQTAASSEFAEGLYVRDNPVNGTDPDGHDMRVKLDGVSGTRCGGEIRAKQAERALNELIGRGAVRFGATSAGGGTG